MRFLSVLIFVCTLSILLPGQAAKESVKNRPPKVKPGATLPLECSVVLQTPILEMDKMNDNQLADAWALLEQCVTSHSDAMTKADLRKAFNANTDMLLLLRVRGSKDQQAADDAALGQLKSVCTLVANQNEDLTNRYNKLVGDYNGLVKAYQLNLVAPRPLSCHSYTIAGDIYTNCY